MQIKNVAERCLQKIGVVGFDQTPEYEDMLLVSNIIIEQITKITNNLGSEMDQVVLDGSSPYYLVSRSSNILKKGPVTIEIPDYFGDNKIIPDLTRILVSDTNAFTSLYFVYDGLNHNKWVNITKLDEDSECMYYDRDSIGFTAIICNEIAPMFGMKYVDDFNAKMFGIIGSYNTSNPGNDDNWTKFF